FLIGIHGLHIVLLLQGLSDRNHLQVSDKGQGQGNRPDFRNLDPAKIMELKRRKSGRHYPYYLYTMSFQIEEIDGCRCHYHYYQCSWPVPEPFFDRHEEKNTYDSYTEVIKIGQRDTLYRIDDLFMEFIAIRKLHTQQMFHLAKDDDKGSGGRKSV